MSKVNELLLAESENFITALYTENLPDTLIFHDLEHVLAVKKEAEMIGEQAGLSTDEMNLLRFCALFYQSGYTRSFDRHKEESIRIATDFLKGKAVDQAQIDVVTEVIRGTGLPQDPKNRIAEVLCDADLMYMASDNAIEQFDLLNDEGAIVKPIFEKRSLCEKRFLDSLAAHTYFTEYGKNVLQPKKEAAIKRIMDRMKRRKMIDSKKPPVPKKRFTYSRGVDTMFRITARNQINLNSIADNKSNILISVNAIIISIIITMLAGNIGNMSRDILPIIIFLVICLITIIIAIMSTRPNLVLNKFTKEDLKNKKVDLIFFGNFIKLDYDEYLTAVKEVMTDDDHLYSILLKNQYELGKILSKKFRLVKVAYNVFMIGIIITVIAFLLNYLVIARPA